MRKKTKVSQAMINRKDKNDRITGAVGRSVSTPGVSAKGIPIEGGEFSGRNRQERRLRDRLMGRG